MARRILRPGKKSNLLVRDVEVLQHKREAVAEAAFELFLAVFKTVLVTFLIEARQGLIAREKRLQALLGEAICYGVERGRFAADNTALKAHSIIVLAHAWAIRHWVFAGELESIEDYLAFLAPMVLAMLEKRPGAKEPKMERRRPVAVGADAVREPQEITTQ